MNPLEQFGVNECPWHPHNLYLQIAAETGLIGLILFCLISIYLGASAVSSYWKSHDKNNIASAIILIALFPIQTYSQAFGQSRNFYLWTVIGFALSIIRSQKIKNDNDQSKLI
jgi:O-antigen ligase